MSSLIEKFSGVVINQNVRPDSDHYHDVSSHPWTYQEVFLPNDYPRGADGSEIIYPDLSGIQVLSSVTDADTAAYEWTLEYQIFGLGWVELGSGSSTGCHATGTHVWFDILFEDPIEITETISGARLRIGLRTTAGIDKIWYSAPNPLALDGFVKAYESDKTTPIENSGDEVSLCFRVLGLVAESGVDFLGNSYRSAVAASRVAEIDAINGDVSKTWMSKPNPSRFAVESLYFDVRPQEPTTYVESSPGEFDPVTGISDQSVVVDGVVVDPVTPGVYFNVYYTSEGNPGTSEEDWENKLWIRVPLSFKATKRETHALPEPISAKYIKIEFTHLQAKSYAPGDFARPTKYKKHPRWVLDYFLLRTESQKRIEDKLINRRVAVIYDAYDLAYNYYLDDLKQEPNRPVEIDPSYTNEVNSYLSSSDNLLDQVDSEMIEKISIAFRPYRENPSGFAKSDYVLGEYAKDSASDFLTNYPFESPSTPNFKYSDLNGLRSQSVIFESDYPVMFFFITCRHKYREIVADFSHDRAYFVGVKEIAFVRDKYQISHDSTQYIEPGGDLANTERNDFTLEGGVMVA